MAIVFSSIPAEEAEQEPQQPSYVCVDCKTPAPKREVDTPLLSTRFGWRLTRLKTASGLTWIEWRCPVCWHAYKSRPPEST